MSKCAALRKLNCVGFICIAENKCFSLPVKGSDGVRLSKYTGLKQHIVSLKNGMIHKSHSCNTIALSCTNIDIILP